MKYIKNIFIKIKTFFNKFKKNKVKKSMVIIPVNNQETNPLDVNLVDNTISNNDRNTLRQYSKVLVTILTAVSIVWITWSYILATIAVMNYENFDPLESLSSQVCITILGVSIGYFAKAFIETYSEKKQDLKNAKFEAEQNQFTQEEPLIINNQSIVDSNNKDECD